LEADGTRSTQDVRHPRTKRSGDSHNRLTIRCAQWIAGRAAAWRRRRVAVARPVRNAFCTNLRFYLTFRKRSENRPSTQTEYLELVRLPKRSLRFSSKNAWARHEPVLFTVVNDPRLTRAISRRCAIARRRQRALLLIDDIKYAFQPRAVLADVGARGVPRRRAVEHYKSSYGV